MVTVNYGWTIPTVGGSENTWGDGLTTLWTDLDTLLDGVSQVQFAALKDLDQGVATTDTPTFAGVATGGNVTLTGGTENWTVTASGTDLTFAYNGVNKMRISSSGDMVVTGNVTGYGTIT